MSLTPVYELLRPQVSKRKATKKEIKTLENSMERVDAMGFETMYLLIHEYNRSRPKSKRDTSLIPFGGVQNGKDIDYEISEMPNMIIKILLEFVTMYYAD